MVKGPEVGSASLEELFMKKVAAVAMAIQLLFVIQLLFMMQLLFVVAAVAIAIQLLFRGKEAVRAVATKLLFTEKVAAVGMAILLLFMEKGKGPKWAFLKDVQRWHVKVVQGAKIGQLSWKDDLAEPMVAEIPALVC